MKKILSAVVIYMLVMQIFVCNVTYADDIQELTDGWYIAKTETPITNETTEAWFTSDAPSDGETILAIQSVKNGGAQIYKRFDEPVSGKLRVSFDLYSEVINGFGLSFLTEPDADETDAQIFSIDTAGGGWAYNPTSALGSKNAQPYSPVRRPSAASWQSIIFDVDTDTGMVSGMIENLAFASSAAIDEIKDKTIYGITLLNARGSNSFMKYVRNMHFYDLNGSIGSICGASDKIVAYFNRSVSTEILENSYINDEENAVTAIKNIDIAQDGLSAVITLADEMTVGKTYTLNIEGGYLLESGLYALNDSKSFVCSSSGLIINSFDVRDEGGVYTADVDMTQIAADTNDKIIIASVSEKEGIICGFKAVTRDASDVGNITFTEEFIPADDSDTVYFYIWHEDTRAPVFDAVILER